MDSFWPLSYPRPRITSNFWVYNPEILKKKIMGASQSNFNNNNNNASTYNGNLNNGNADFGNINGLSEQIVNENDEKIYEIAWSRVMFYPNIKNKYGIYSCPIWEYSNPARLMKMNNN